MFVNVSHPSEFFGKGLQKQIRSFTARQNESRKRKKRLKLKQEISLAAKNVLPLSKTESPSRASPHVPSTHLLKSNTELDFKIFPPLRLKLCVDVANPEQALRALDYHLNVLGPHGAWSCSNIYCEKCSSDRFKHSMIQMIIMDPLLLEASIALSMAHLDGCCKSYAEHRHGYSSVVGQRSQDVLHHRGRFLSILLQRMKATWNVMDDASLFAILTMIILDSTIPDWDAYTVNLAGLGQLLARKGGVNALEFGCFFRTQLTWANLRVTTHTIAQRLTPSKVLLMPDYSTLPYEPSLCFKISRLPVGLTQVVLSGGLSKQVIDFLVSVYEWTKQFDPQAEECNQSRDYYTSGLKLISSLAGILVQFDLKPAERILCIGLYAYINSTDGRRVTQRQPRGLHDLLVDMDELSEKAELLGPELVWAALAIASNNDTITWTAERRWCLLDRYLDQPNTLRRWTDVEALLETFFWTPALHGRWRTCWETALQRRACDIASSTPSSVASTVEFTSCT